MDLHRKCLGKIKISRITNLNVSTIKNWLYLGAKPRVISERAEDVIKKRSNLLPKKSTTLSQGLGFILGVVYGDGSVYFRLSKNNIRTNGVISLEVTDKELALKFREILNKWSGRPTKIRFRDTRGSWRVRLYSTQAARFIKGFKLTNLKKASQHVKSAFLRGFFDSEGGVYKTTIKVCNINQSLILLVRDLLDSFGIYTRMYKCGKLYSLCISNRKGRELFKEKVGFTISRKQKRLIKSLLHKKPYYKNSIDGRIRNKKIRDNILKECDSSIRFKKIKEQYNLTYDETSSLLKYMVRCGDLERVERGDYRLMK